MKPLKLNEDDEQITITAMASRSCSTRPREQSSNWRATATTCSLPGGGPKLHLWRAPHRNDDMWAYDDWQQLRPDRLEAQDRPLRRRGSPACPRCGWRSVIQADGQWTASASLHSAVYTVYGDGSIAVDNAVFRKAGSIPLARLGVRLLLDKRFDHFTYPRPRADGELRRPQARFRRGALLSTRRASR